LIRLLAHQIMSDLPPRGTRRGSLAKRIESNTRNVFTTANRNNPGAILGSHSHGQLHWYQASKQSVYGVAPEMNLGSPDVASMANLMKRSMGKKLRRIGRHGKPQNVYQVNRFLVTKTALSAFQRAKLARVGRMKAGMLPAIEAFGCKKPVPAWVKRHAASQPPGSAKDITRGQGRAELPDDQHSARNHAPARRHPRRGECTGPHHGQAHCPLAHVSEPFRTIRAHP
jgi:hypothetical protein